MSHYTEMEVEITDEECLIKALESMGFQGKVERYQVATNLYGYQGDVRSQKAHVVIRRKHVGSAANDIGFERRLGKFVAHISEYDRCKYNEAWIGKLKQAYAVEVAIKGARSQGWIAKKYKLNNGDTQVVLVKN